VLLGGWLLADVGWLGDGRGGSRLNGGMDRGGGRAGVNTGNRGLRRRRVLGLVLVEALLLVA
jgi:hypothetical protein